MLAAVGSMTNSLGVMDSNFTEIMSSSITTVSLVNVLGILESLGDFIVSSLTFTLEIPVPKIAALRRDSQIESFTFARSKSSWRLSLIIFTS